MRRGPPDAGHGEVYGDPAGIEAWGTAIRAAVQAHDDLPLAVVVGADQVIVLAMDDPRVETTSARLDLAATVADIVDPRAAAPTVRAGPKACADLRGPGLRPRRLLRWE